MIIILTVIFVLLPATVFGIGYPACPPGWVSLPGSYTCYKFYYEPLPWIGAKAYCSSLLPNSALLIVDNAPEANLVGSLTGGAEIWVGDELGSPYGQPNCLKAIVVGGIQKLALAPCNIPYPYVCELDISPNPCYPQPAYNALATYHPHPTLPYKYIQCTTDGRNYVQLCAKGTVWSQAIYTCDFPPAPPPHYKRRKRSDGDDYPVQSEYDTPSYNSPQDYGPKPKNTYDFERLAPIKLPIDYAPEKYGNYGPSTPLKGYAPSYKPPTKTDYPSSYDDNSYGSQLYDLDASAAYKGSQYSQSSNYNHPTNNAERNYDGNPYKTSPGSNSYPSPYDRPPSGPYKSASYHIKSSPGKRPPYSKPAQAYRPPKKGFKRPVYPSNNVNRYNVTSLDASYGGFGKSGGSREAPKQYDIGYKE